MCTCEERSGVQLPALGLELGLLGVPDLGKGAAAPLSGQTPARVQHQVLEQTRYVYSMYRKCTIT